MVSRGTVDIATLTMIYVILGLGLNVVVGLSGLLVLGYGVLLWASAPVISDLAQVTGGWALLVGLLWALVLSVPTLALGRVLKVFSLRIFSK